MIRAVPSVLLAGGLALMFAAAAPAQTPAPPQVQQPRGQAPAPTPAPAPRPAPAPQAAQPAPAQPRPPQGGVAPTATERGVVERRRNRTYAGCNRAALRRALKGGERRRFITRCRLGYDIPPRPR